MHTFKLASSAALMVFLLAGNVATAADSGNFTGFTLGGSAGVAHTSVDYSGYIDGKSSSKNTFTGGINAAYGFALNDAAVLSIGASYVLGKTKAGETTYQENGDTVRVSGKLKNHWSVFVAPGYRFAPQWLGYAKLSYHVAKGEYADTLMGSGTSNHHGVGYGAGISYTFAPQLEVNAELQHVRFNSADFALSSGRPEVTELNVGVNYRF
jgi:opacity protein-like surface antigen